MKKVSVLTATRAEYGLLKTLINKLMVQQDIYVEVVVTGAHLSPEFGLSYQEILEDHIPISKKIEILLSSDTPEAISKSMGLALISFSEYFSESKPDILIVLGDRYETLAVCCSAMNARIPIVHLHGGETTEGAIDEAIRHAITKLSYLHFASTEAYRNRIIQLGENPDRVYNVGALGVENAMHTEVLSKRDLENSLQVTLEQYGVVTFHPVTLEPGQAESQVIQLLETLVHYKELKFVVTKANADMEGRAINSILTKYAEKYPNILLFDSLGTLKYLSAIKYSDIVIGNSSSGLIEVPSFKVPTVNIGDRQKGRLHGDSVINCEISECAIKLAIDKALSPSFKKVLKSSINPYGDGNTSERMVKILRDYLFNDKIKLMKKFHDL